MSDATANSTGGPLQLSLFDGPAGPDAEALPMASPSWGRTDGSLPKRAQPAAPVSPEVRRFVHPSGQREVRLLDCIVVYRMRRSRRRSIGFVVGMEGLTVSAPRWVTLSQVDDALRNKAAWILSKLHEQTDRARRVQAHTIGWRDGSELPFLGESLVLVVDPRFDGVELRAHTGALPGIAHRQLHVGVPAGASSLQVREAVQGWMQREALRHFQLRCEVFAARLGVQMRRLRLSSASTRWGSASVDGTIRLNWRLIHFAPAVIDYVVAHELAHLREMNHGAAFWEIVRTAVPDFVKARDALHREVLPQLE
ncbi:MAG: M48 family metallopeptidase [Aquabacterium sp.]